MMRSSTKTVVAAKRMTSGQSVSSNISNIESKLRNISQSNAGNVDNWPEEQRTQQKGRKKQKYKTEVTLLKGCKMEKIEV